MSLSSHYGNHQFVDLMSLHSSTPFSAFVDFWVGKESNSFEKFKTHRKYSLKHQLSHQTSTQTVMNSLLENYFKVIRSRNSQIVTR